MVLEFSLFFLTVGILSFISIGLLDGLPGGANGDELACQGQVT